MFCCLIVISGTFYENLKKLRLDDNFIVKSISTTVLNRVSYFNHSLLVIVLFISHFILWPLAFFSLFTYGNYGRFCNKFDLIQFVGLTCIHISNQQIHFETCVLTLGHCHCWI